MTRVMLLLAAFICASTMAHAGGGPNDPPAEERLNPYTGVLPPCDDAGVLWHDQQPFRRGGKHVLELAG